MEKLYVAAVEPERWPDFLSALTAAMDANMASAMLTKTSPGGVQEAVSVNLPEDGLRVYAEHFVADDLWRRRGAGLPEGTTLVGEQLVPQSELRQSGFHHDFLRPYEIGHLCSVILKKHGPWMGFVSVYRTPGQGEFQTAHTQMLGLLRPHFDRAIACNRRLAEASAGAALGMDILERLPTGAILLASGGSITHANAAARTILAARDGLLVRGGRLVASRRSDSATLDRAIVVATTSDSLRRGDAMMVSRPSLRAGYSVLIVPLHLSAGVTLAPEAAAAALVLIGDSEERRPLNTAAIGRLYGLTGAEARVTAAVVVGSRLTEIAREHGVSVNTVRTQIKQVFAKTGSTTQAELVRLLLTGPAALTSR